jgi:actin cytoskeleton-regulatory complex protein SLA1
VGLNGEYGFAPANYIEITEGSPSKPESLVSTRLPDRPTVPETDPVPSSPASSIQGPAATLAGILHKQQSTHSPTASRSISSSGQLPPRPQYTPDASDGEEEAPPPALPQRPQSQTFSPPPQYASLREEEDAPGVQPSPPYNRATYRDGDDDSARGYSGGFHLYNINEMVSAMGKRKKMPTTLGINVATGTVMISPEKSRDGPQQEWTAEKLTHYSIEGKHVFVELVRPSKSIHFHAGAKDTAQEIVSMLSEIAGAMRAEGLREVIAAGSGGGAQKKGQILYDFLAQGDDEVTVGVGDDVIVLDDKESQEWWKVRRLKNGKEGVVPSSYIEITGVVTAAPSSSAGINAGRSTVEQNRLEEERLAKEATRSSRKRGGSDARGAEVGPGLTLPERGSSLVARDDGNKKSSQRSKRDSKDGKSSPSKSSEYSTCVGTDFLLMLATEPNAAKVRMWTDRTGSFKVEAEFIALKDSKIHLHKLNGVKIAVPISKMAVEDLEYVEGVTGISLDEDKPLSDIRRRGPQSKSGPASDSSPSKPSSSSDQPKGPEYDWFDFFLKCGVGPHQCERYSQNFNKDSMDESILPEITPETLRSLGLKEGDILRVMKHLDSKYGRTGKQSKLRNVSFAGEEGDEAEDGDGTQGGLFSGAGGALRNNTRKGRPAPPVQTSDVVDAKAFEQKDGKTRSRGGSDARATPLTTAPPRKESTSGFDDDAWDLKPSKQRTQPTPSASTAAPLQPTLTGSMAELSLLSSPLEPSKAQPAAPVQPAPPPQPIPALQPIKAQPTIQTPQQQPQPTGANPSFFSQLPPQQSGAQFGQQNFQQSLPQQQTGFPQQQVQPLQPGFAQQQVQQQPTGFPQQQIAPPRQRPQAPPTMQQGSLILPPPPRPLSAPQNFPQQNNFGPPPLQPQLTGIPSSTPQVAPPGQSLNDLNQYRFQQQQYAQQRLPPQPTGFPQQGLGQNQFGTGLAPQQTGYVQQQQFGIPQQQAFINGQQTGSPFADPRPSQFSTLSAQQTGYNPNFQAQPQQPMRTGINSTLPQALQPQSTGFANGFNRPGFGQPPLPIPPVPPIPQQSTPAPLVAQKTGPAPPVRFGVQADTKKLAPQPTGRRANLSQASKCNIPLPA